MSLPKRLVATACFALFALLPFAAGGASEETGAPTIYKWVDEHGIAHYTTDRDRIPREIRKTLRSVPALPDVAARPPAQTPGSNPPDTAFVGPLPDTNSPESWSERNARPLPTRLDREAAREAERSAELEALDAEIAAVELEIADRENQLLALLGHAQDEELVEDPEFRAIAEELPGLQADLEALREQRDDYENP